MKFAKAIRPRRLTSLLQLLLSGGIFLMVACSETSWSPTTPTPGPDPIPPIEHPRVDVPFSWDHYQGFTAFALGHPDQTEEDITGLYSEAMAHGWNTARICSETEFWEGSAEYPKKPRDPERLRWTLDIIARIPGAQVLLIGDCTLKGPVSEQEKRAWARQVAAAVYGQYESGPYKNVAIETHNEFDNCRGRGWGPHCPGKQDVSAHVAIYRAAGIQFVTADDSLCWPIHGESDSKTFSFRLANIGAWPPDFHPCRTKGREPWDPMEGFLNQVRDFNGEPFVLSETVAWMDYSGNCGGLRTCDQSRINTAIKACADVSGCRFTYHSEWLLAGASPTWWPEAR